MVLKAGRALLMPREEQGARQTYIYRDIQYAKGVYSNKPKACSVLV